MDKSIFTGSVQCDATSLAEINVVCGFHPSAVEVFNPANGVRIWWTDDMQEGTANKIAPAAGRIGLLDSAKISIDQSEAYISHAPVYSQSLTGFTNTAAATAAVGAASVTKSTWGAFGWSQKLSDGTIASGPNATVMSATTEAKAVESIAATSAGYVRLGYVTVKAKAGSDWVGAKSAFADAQEYHIYNDAPIITTSKGISLYTSATFAISEGTTPGGGAGFTIGADTDLQVEDATLMYKAWR